MIKAFLFDYGGVMSTGGHGTELPERLSKILGVSWDEAYQWLAPVWDEFSRGKLTEERFWEAFEARCGQTIPPDKRGIWNTWHHVRPLPEMVALVKKLQSQDYKVGLLSNVVPVTAAQVRLHGGYDIFDFRVVSCEVGYAKPDPEIYRLALDKLPGVRPEEIAFIDDQERFLVPARALGIQTIHAHNPQQITDSITYLLQREGQQV